MKWLALLLIPTTLFIFSEHSLAKSSRGPASEVAKTSTLKDTVIKLRDDDEGVVVLFENSKGNHYLRREQANFDKIQGILKGSLKDKKPVSVIEETETLNIVDVK